MSNVDFWDTRFPWVLGITGVQVWIAHRLADQWPLWATLVLGCLTTTAYVLGCMDGQRPPWRSEEGDTR